MGRRDPEDQRDLQGHSSRGDPVCLLDPPDLPDLLDPRDPRDRQDQERPAEAGPR